MPDVNHQTTLSRLSVLFPVWWGNLWCSCGVKYSGWRVRLTGYHNSNSNANFHSTTPNTTNDTGNSLTDVNNNTSHVTSLRLISTSEGSNHYHKQSCLNTADALYCVNSGYCANKLIDWLIHRWTKTRWHTQSSSIRCSHILLYFQNNTYVFNVFYLACSK